MREIAEFRIDERFASMLFSDSEGKRLGDSVRKVEIETSDPRFGQIGKLQRELLRTTGKPFFYGWNLIRKHTAAELDSGRLFKLNITAVFEPAGQVSGTKYDELEVCGRCGVGAKQIGPLFLDVRRIPKGKDFARTIAGEVVVSRRVVELFESHGITGAALHPVRTKGAKSLEDSGWSQLVVDSTDAEIVAPTRVGNNPFDDDPQNEYRCPEGHVIGLNLLSDVSIRSSTRGEADILATRQFIGVRRGLLRPERLILISPKLQRLFRSEKITGCRIEVAYLV